MNRLLGLPAWLYHALRNATRGDVQPMMQCLHPYWTACFWGWRYCKTCSEKRAC